MAGWLCCRVLWCMACLLCPELTILFCCVSREKGREDRRWREKEKNRRLGQQGEKQSEQVKKYTQACSSKKHKQNTQHLFRQGTPSPLSWCSIFFPFSLPLPLLHLPISAGSYSHSLLVVVVKGGKKKERSKKKQQQRLATSWCGAAREISEKIFRQPPTQTPTQPTETNAKSHTQKNKTKKTTNKQQNQPD